MKNKFRRWLRAIIERSPGLAAAIRAVRRELHWRRRKPVLTPFGFRFIGDPPMEEGTFEPEETRLILNNLAKCDVLIDVGANVGYYTCLALNAGKAAVAFEPLPQNLQVLFRNLEENGWTDAEVWPIGLGEKPSLAPIYGAHTGASLVPGWAGVSKSWKQMIAVNTMDNVLSDRFAGKGMVIKIDVEGAEFGVLKGARETLRRQPRPVWIVEIMLDIHRAIPNPNFQCTFHSFWENGYEARTADGGNRLVKKEDVDRWLKIGKCDFGTHNWLFVAAAP